MPVLHGLHRIVIRSRTLFLKSNIIYVDVLNVLQTQNNYGQALYQAPRDDKTSPAGSRLHGLLAQPCYTSLAPKVLHNTSTQQIFRHRLCLRLCSVFSRVSRSTFSVRARQSPDNNMRLLRTADLTFHEYEGSSIPPYAILSHRWEGEEVTYQEFKHRTAAIESKSGFGKIQQCCQQAQEDKIKFVWVDTCYIDKSSSAELSEAINSMYQWYQRSQVCYVYLSDVGTSSSFRKSVDDGLPVTLSRRFISRIMRSKWWTRGWTLQELIAPVSVVSYVNGQGSWVKVGSKSTLLDLIVARTSIEGDILRGQEVSSCSVAQRMSWASERETSRSEDLAYCLLGLFGVNMPLLYGEGTKAFLRLQVRSL